MNTINYSNDNQLDKLSIGGGRIAYLDILKCLAIVYVVKGHVDGMKLGISTYDTLRGCIEYTFQMPLFFFISGMFASRGIAKGKCLHVLLMEKAKTLLWPAILFFCIFALVKDGRVNMPTEGLGCFWFTFTLFECFAIYYLFAYFLRRHTKLLNIL
ncbi:MAG: acyltransferase family protein, partial [Prevotella sp.]|nr:acyltransferase family protein [Prevotella sp.]